MSPHVGVSLLGGFALEYQGASVLVSSQRLQSLFAYLALHFPQPQPRQRLAYVLWPDSPEAQARTNLRTLLHRLQSLIPHSDQMLSVEKDMVVWQTGTVLEVDVRAFETTIDHARAARDRGDDDIAHDYLERAARWYSGALLPECYDEWVLDERERLCHLMVAALEQLIALMTARRAYHDAIPYARRLVLFDPLNEASHLTLMQLHLSAGERASALSVYHACASLLRAELGLAPGAALTTLYGHIVSAESAAESLQADTPLVGRHREWQRMHAVWQVVAAGQPRLLVLSGEPGIGKTRLAHEFMHWATHQGILTAMAECYPAEGNLAYAEVTSLLRADGLQHNIAHLDAIMAYEIARLLPELLSQNPELPQPPPLHEAWQRQRLFEALALAVGGSGRPTALLIDDLQWCSQETLEWLHYLLRFDPTARLLVIGTVRDDALEVEHPLHVLVDALQHRGRLVEIGLDRLSEPETQQLADQFSSKQLGADEIANLYAETEGNPLFVVEMIRAALRPPDDGAVRDSGQLPIETDAGLQTDLPPVVRSVIAARLNRVAPATRAVLEASAVIGRQVSVDVLRRTAELEEAPLARALDELWLRRILREQDAASYDFTHEKLRAVAYAGISPARRAALHRRVAEALEAAYGAETEAVSAQLARHYERAGMADQAVRHYQQAAAYARRLYANTSALAHCQRALALLGERPPPGAIELLDQLGEVAHVLGRYDEARRVWQRALEIAPPTQHIVRADLYRKLGNTSRDQFDFEAAQRLYDAADAALCATVDQPDAEVWSCRTRIEFERISMLYWQGHSDEMLERIQRISSLIERTGLPLVQARWHHLRALALLERSRFGVSWAAADHARANLRLLAAGGDTAALPAAHFQLGFMLLWAGDLAAAEEECATALRLAERSGDISLEGRCLTYLTVIARKRGDIDSVRRFGEASLRVALGGEMPAYIGAAHGNLAWVAWRAGDRARVRGHGLAALEAWSHQVGRYMFEWIGRWPLIGILLAEDQHLAAVSHIRALLREDQQRPPPDVEPLMEAAVRAGDDGYLDSAAQRLEEAAARAPAHGYL